MNGRILSIATIVCASAVACTTSTNEKHRATTQGVEIGDGGDDADPDADADAGSDAGDACAHPICATGGALVAACDPCATQLCAQDPYCCTTTWDATCVGEVASICGKTCTTTQTDAGGSTCSHPICAAGVALSAACDTCATQLCGQDPYCCAVTWDATCVGEVTSICGIACN